MIGMRATSDRIHFGSMASKPTLALRSDRLDQEPPPAAIATPVVGWPVPSIPVTNRAPPVARAANSLGAAELKSKLLLSAKRNAPLGLICRAKLSPTATSNAPVLALSADLK